jgi:hypothetical protein
MSPGSVRPVDEELNGAGYKKKAHDANEDADSARERSRVAQICIYRPTED